MGSAPCGFHRWRGDYGGKKQLWFPSNYVEEMVSPASLEPEREVSTEPRWWDTPATHAVRVPVHAWPPSPVVHSHPLWGHGFQDTCCVCVVLCMLVRCVVACTQTARPMHAYSRHADEPMGFAFHSTWTRTAPWGTCSGGSWMCRLVRLVSPHPVFQPTVLRVRLSFVALSVCHGKKPKAALTLSSPCASIPP